MYIPEHKQKWLMPALLFVLLVCQLGSLVDYVSEDSVARYDHIVTGVLWWTGIPALLIALLIFINDEKEFKSLKIMDFILATIAGICLLLLPPLDARLEYFGEMRTTTDESTIQTLSNRVVSVESKYSQATNALAMATNAAANAQLAAKSVTDALKPPTFDERLRLFLDGIDTRILPALKKGQTRFSGFIWGEDRERLEKLCSEPEASEYITLLPSRHDIANGKVDVDFILSTNLLK